MQSYRLSTGRSCRPRPACREPVAGMSSGPKPSVLRNWVPRSVAEKAASLQPTIPASSSEEEEETCAECSFDDAKCWEERAELIETVKTMTSMDEVELYDTSTVSDFSGGLLPAMPTSAAMPPPHMPCPLCRLLPAFIPRAPFA